MTENNYQQAMLPEGCTVLDNDWGTAPGVAFEADGVRVIMLPGPPRECRAMFTHRAMPYLQEPGRRGHRLPRRSSSSASGSPPWRPSSGTR